MAVIFQLSCVLLPVLLIVIVKALKNQIDEYDRDIEWLQQVIELRRFQQNDRRILEEMTKLEMYRATELEAHNQNEDEETETESLLNRLAKINEQLERANDAWAENSHAKSQKPFGVYKKNQAYECSLCGAIFVDSDRADYCPVCGRKFNNPALYKISAIKYKWLRYWRSRQ